MGISNTSADTLVAPVVTTSLRSMAIARDRDGDSGPSQNPTIHPPQEQSASTTKPVPLLPRPPLAPLLPNHSPSWKRRHSLVKPSRRCNVPICHFKACTLKSHRQAPWSRGSQSMTEPKPCSKSGNCNEDDPESLSATDSDLHDLSSQALVIYQEIDGLPSLPIDSCEVPGYRTLFYEFFNHHYARLVRVAFPPPFSVAGKKALETARRRAVEVALSEPVFCMSRVVQAHHEIVCEADYRCLNHYAVAAHTKLLELLRAKLDTFRVADIAEIIPVIYQVFLLDAAAGRWEAIHNHRKLLKHLIDTCGGVTRIPRVMPIVLSLDRAISIAIDVPPVYVPPPNHLIRRPRFVPLLYGSYLDSESSRELLGKEIHQYCLDSCNAIEIMECEGWSFDPRDPPFHNAPNIHYFFYIRDCLVYDFARLSMETIDDKTIGRCVLLIAKIVDYLVTFDNYVIVLPILIGQKFQAIVNDHECEIDWQRHQPVLIWSLFVLATLTESWSGHHWAVVQLRQQLDLRYGSGRWPDEWRQYELNNLRCFVWSNTRLCGRFKTVCDELRSTTSEVYD